MADWTRGLLRWVGVRRMQEGRGGRDLSGPPGVSRNARGDGLVRTGILLPFSRLVRPPSAGHDNMLDFEIRVHYKTKVTLGPRPFPSFNQDCCSWSDAGSGVALGRREAGAGVYCAAAARDKQRVCGCRIGISHSERLEDGAGAGRDAGPLVGSLASDGARDGRALGLALGVADDAGVVCCK